MGFWVSYNRPVFNFFQFFVNGEVELGGGVRREFYYPKDIEIGKGGEQIIADTGNNRKSEKID